MYRVLVCILIINYKEFFNFLHLFLTSLFSSVCFLGFRLVYTVLSAILCDTRTQCTVYRMLGFRRILKSTREGSEQRLGLVALYSLSSGLGLAQ